MARHKRHSKKHAYRKTSVAVGRFSAKTAMKKTKSDKMARRKTRTIYRFARRGYRRSKGAMPIVNKVAKGLGYGVLAGTVAGMFMPQFKDIAAIGGAFYGGGIYGAGAQLLLGGGLSSITGLLGGTGTTGGSYG